MAVCLRCRVLALLVLALLVHGSVQSCAEFRDGQAGFVLNTEESVSAGATYLSYTNLSHPTDPPRAQCVSACCRTPRCNLALIHTGPEEDTHTLTLTHTLTHTRCFLFDCLYRNQFVCSFIRKPDYSNHIREEVYQTHLRGPGGKTGNEDKPPIADAGADVVTRAGEEVMLNGIESWDDKNITKYEWTLNSGNQSVRMEKTHFVDQCRLSNLYPGVYRFRLLVTDSAGQSDTASVTVLVLTQEQAEGHCLTPVKVGPCRGSFPRWHYNAASGVCERFTFGGCIPNSNNYLTQGDCSAACNGTTVVHGARKIKPEVCNSSCEDDQFKCSSNCCIDSSEVCDGQPHCRDGSDEEDCQRMNMTLAQLLEIKVDEEKARCVDPPVTGPCRASLPRWFYDPLKQKCFHFTYGGCRGNKNNFEKKDECMKICEGVTESDVFVRGLFERSEEAMDKHTGSAAVGAIIAVLILAVIGLLGCYCVRNRNRKRKSESQRAAAAPASVPLAGDPH